MVKIQELIKDFEVSQKRHIELNTKIKEYFEPLLIEAGKNGDREEFYKLFRQLPDCPFLFGAYRIMDLYEMG